MREPRALRRAGLALAVALAVQAGGIAGPVEARAGEAQVGDMQDGDNQDGGARDGGPRDGTPREGAPRDGAARSPVEMAGHRRLLRVMDRAGHRPAPFATDGCSGGLSLAWRGVADRLPPFARTHAAHPPWEPCCVTHDRAYHAAGGARTTRDSHGARLAADEALRACVRETGARRTAGLSVAYGVTEAQVAAAYDLIAEAMFAAVRLGGGPCSGLPWRWGYGYPSCVRPD